VSNGIEFSKHFSKEYRQSAAIAAQPVVYQDELHAAQALTNQGSVADR
jgi:hypothetical protein